MSNFIERINGPLLFFAVPFQSILLLMIRLYWGYQFFHTGKGKLADIAPIIDYFHSLSIPFPTINAYLASTTECVGGFCLIIGLFSRLVSLPLAFVMCIALLTAHYDAVVMIFEDSQNFILQAPFNFLLASLIVFAFGAGKISADALIGVRDS